MANDNAFMDLRDAQREMVTHPPSLNSPNHNRLNYSRFRFQKVQTLADHLDLEKKLCSFPMVVKDIKECCTLVTAVYYKNSLLGTIKKKSADDIPSVQYSTEDGSLVLTTVYSPHKPYFRLHLII